MTNLLLFNILIAVWVVIMYLHYINNDIEKLKDKE